MAKTLKPDVIEWILKLNSTQAQEEYHKFEKANRELKKENDATGGQWSSVISRVRNIPGNNYNGKANFKRTENFCINNFDIKNNIIIFAV